MLHNQNLLYLPKPYFSANMNNKFELVEKNNIDLYINKDGVSLAGKLPDKRVTSPLLYGVHCEGLERMAD